MSPGNPFKSSFHCHSYEPLEWSPFHQVDILPGGRSTKLPLERVVVEWNGVVSLWSGGIECSPVEYGGTVHSGLVPLVLDIILV